jgi:LysR family transcriptional regulator, low CO2-responsive transcriptional regulator
MRYSQLKAFHHVALLGGFSRAAEALFLTQPAISEQVRKLEQEHDVLLFFRERKRTRLTEAGEHLFRLTKQFFETEQQISEYMSETSAVTDGSLRIIADSAHHVTGILGRFQKRYPHVVVSLRSGNTEEILEGLRSYSAEIGVVGGLSRGREMETLDLGSTAIVAFAAKVYFPAEKTSISLQELSALPLIFRETGSKTRQKLEDAAREKGVPLFATIEAEGREAVHEVVASGAGIGFVSLAEYGHDDRLIKLPLTGVRIQMSETMVHLGQRRDVKVIRAFMDIARHCQAETAPEQKNPANS